jgi:hypothetical protein
MRPVIHDGLDDGRGGILSGVVCTSVTPLAHKEMMSGPRQRSCPCRG